MRNGQWVQGAGNRYVAGVAGVVVCCSCAPGGRQLYPIVAASSSSVVFRCRASAVHPVVSPCCREPVVSRPPVLTKDIVSEAQCLPDFRTRLSLRFFFVSYFPVRPIRWAPVKSTRFSPHQNCRLWGLFISNFPLNSSNSAISGSFESPPLASLLLLLYPWKIEILD